MCKLLLEFSLTSVVVLEIVLSGSIGFELYGITIKGL